MSSLQPAQANYVQSSHRRSRSTGFLSNIEWYEAGYASDHSNHELLFHNQARHQAPEVRFPSQTPEDPSRHNGENSGRLETAPSSTISNIIDSYGDDDLAENPNSHGNTPSGMTRIQSSGAYHKHGQLSQSAWSPRPSNEGFGFEIQRQSTHGEILNVADEQDDAIREFLRRRGTPPLLFGANSVGSNQRQLVEGDDGVIDDGDWETVEGLSRRETQGFTQTQANNSSFADYSSSSTGMRPSGLPPGGQVLEPPYHPQYVRSWNMFRDQQTGQTMLLSDTGTTGGFNVPCQTMSSPVHGQADNYNYHHPSPLSEGHTNPFTSFPATAGRSSSSQYSNDGSNAGGTDDSALEMSPTVKKRVNLLTDVSSGKDHSSAWVSTDEGNPYTKMINKISGCYSRKPSGAILEGNVTGTPDGTGTRQVGSSIANASSPGANFSSSPFVVTIDGEDVRMPEATKKLHRSLSIDSSLSSLESGDSYLQNRRVSPKGKLSEPEDIELTALPSFAHL